ncbi:hypothetical protein N7495_009344 [Penicillium taxi]|uniref:uncharacterized protein n=1 Tax=Penicillium taxi TaxID=168475 RepID=UPI002545BC9E|nr:uncharacterized protein N7495_009344 [Penicillium taxi]KAJ5884834.1 hypothetical protein N7495_009344 [Penicillium taxi]
MPVTETDANCLRDHELRFTVHESPDYFKLKVSVFNDDKKTDLIGETWIDLQNLIIPGGSQNDHWHPLQSRGKYAGDIRLEMTYYDTREQDEALIGRRKEAAERVQGKTHASSNSSPSVLSSLSGPRQLNAVKRRPLPTDPSGATPPQPSPLHHPMSARPPTRDHANTVPPVQVSTTGQDFDSRPLQPRAHSDSDRPPQRDYHPASQYQTDGQRESPIRRAPSAT